ncbi:hypothetical protein [Ktedonospora formicarum]|uniref:Uncharacterized protein n=1 Tax=Ktedonospora formicarum TaxID=2778364 RepID=A0A8J3IBM1_9CHLR|nr:hypothetical protein [Ktedonospora formicarum]GHO49084.1 hypothetical protein KSX_72470 [Ktedonospora formicarum]
MELVQQYWSAYWSFVLQTLDSLGVQPEYQFLCAVVITFVFAMFVLKVLRSIFGGSSHASSHYHPRSGFSDHGWHAMENARRAHQNAADNAQRAHQNAVRIHQNMMHRH